jgi:hypothetical protein
MVVVVMEVVMKAVSSRTWGMRLEMKKRRRGKRRRRRRRRRRRKTTRRMLPIYLKA